MKKYFLFIFLLLTSSVLFAQEQIAAREMPYFTFGKGIGMAPPDSSFLLNIRFRMQNRIAFNTHGGDHLDVQDAEARVRRLRLRFDGFAYDPRLTYVIQLSFTRGDMDYDAMGFPNIIRDAMIFYAVTPKFTVGMGQTKLPGNRQRVNSSGDLQFPDRSIVNANFNVDRDFGIQLYYNDHIGKLFYVLRGAVSSGEGRNFNTTGNGLAFTGRVELLPMGKFKNNGDYFEGDLMREPTPKVSIAFGASANHNALRTGGQLGTYLFEPRDINTTMADFLFKYRGFAFAAEWISRTTENPLTEDEFGNQAFVVTGNGYTAQTSYLFKNNFEVAARYSEIVPGDALAELEEHHKQYSVGATRYLKGHRVKIQADGGYDQLFSLIDGSELPDNWFVRFQIELGI
jgi:hypothetical protein